MEAEEALRRLGGVAPSAELVAVVGRRRLRTALAAGTVQRATRGRVVLREVTHQRLVAARLHGTLSHLSAAQHLGWPVLHPPDATWVTVPRNRKVARTIQRDVHAAWTDLQPSDHESGVTTPLRTVLDCARRLPFAEALVVADSALRLDVVAQDELRAAARTVRGPGAAQVRRVARRADARAANPFESALRAIALDHTDLDLVPQHPVATRGRTYHPDLVDVRRRVVLEADSWGFHADREAHARDCVRYNALTLAGWLVLRFTWEHVVHSPAYVASALRDVAAAGHPQPGCA